MNVSGLGIVTEFGGKLREYLTDARSLGTARSHLRDFVPQTDAVTLLKTHDTTPPVTREVVVGNGGAVTPEPWTGLYPLGGLE